MSSRVRPTARRRLPASWRVRRVLAAGLACALAGCGGRPGADAPLAGIVISGADYRHPGTHAPTVADWTLRSVGGCELGVRVYRPGGPSVGAVVLGHGFLRSARRHEGLARHLASWGLEVAVADFCNSTVFAGNHDLNAADMRRVADALARTVPGRRVAYAGMSAGGLSALLAAAEDAERARAVLGLDTVDDRSAADALARLGEPSRTVTVMALLGEPSSCNRQLEIARVFERWRVARVLRLRGATHCDFESPTSLSCESLCGAQTVSGALPSPALRALATAALLPLADAQRDAWWLPGGVNARALLDAGVITR